MATRPYYAASILLCFSWYELLCTINNDPINDQPNFYHWPYVYHYQWYYSWGMEPMISNDMKPNWCHWFSKCCIYAQREQKKMKKLGGATRFKAESQTCCRKVDFCFHSFRWSYRPWALRSRWSLIIVIDLKKSKIVNYLAFRAQ